MSLSIAAAVRVGNFIGSGEPALAKISARVALKLTGMTLYYSLVSESCYAILTQFHFHSNYRFYSTICFSGFVFKSQRINFIVKI